MTDTVNDAVTPSTTEAQPTTAGSLLAGSAAETPAAESGQVPQTEGEKLLAGKYKDATELEKAYKALETKIGAKGIIPPKEDASPEEVDQFWRQLGKPESADKYEIATPEGMQADEDLTTWFKETAHKHHLTKSQAEAFAKEYNDWFIQRSNEMAESQFENAVKELRAEYGSKFDQNITAAKSALKNLVGAEEAERIGQMYGRDPGLVRLLVNVHKLTGEDHIADGTTSSGSFDAKTEWNSILKDKSHKYHAAYWNANDPLHKDAVKRVHELADLWGKADE